MALSLSSVLLFIFVASHCFLCRMATATEQKNERKKTFHIILEGYFMIIIVFNNYAYKVGRRERAAAAIGTMTASVQSFYAETTAKWRHILLHRMRLFVWGRYCLLLLLALPFPIPSHLLVEQVTRLQSFFFALEIAPHAGWAGLVSTDDLGTKQLCFARLECL